MVVSRILESMKTSAMSWPGDGQLQLSCPDCDSDCGQWRGYRETKGNVAAHRRRCKRCGRWFQVEKLKLDSSPLSPAEEEELMREHLSFFAWTEAYEQHGESLEGRGCSE